MRKLLLLVLCMPATALAKDLPAEWLALPTSSRFSALSARYVFSVYDVPSSPWKPDLDRA